MPASCGSHKDKKRTAWKWIDAGRRMWDDPTMSTAVMDAKKRVVISAGRPGDVYDVQRQDDSHILLVRLEPARRRKRMTRRACLAAMQEAPLRPRMKWEQLKRLTREP
jgi:hypothetical protein